MSPYGGGHGGGSHQSAGGYGGSTGGHVSAPIAQSSPSRFLWSSSTVGWRLLEFHIIFPE
jgi:hypothetical protein